jgi:hypothetical protein
MQTKEIQESEWSDFFDNFSRNHQGRPVDIEIFGSELGAQAQEKGLSFEGITVEWDEVSGNTIMIMVGASADDHITHSINRPTQVSLGTDRGEDFALAIKGADGSLALLRFQSAVLPEVGDALAP